ncbi:MAG: DUF1326 domain-containing protein [Prosthecobacter sp.]|nr:DUF1326 domain-containing protein [Prosthecobacter sp.]
MKLPLLTSLAVQALVATMLLLSLPTVDAKGKTPFSVAGLFVEGCSCSLPCPCELTALEKGCNGVGAMSLTAGEFNGVKLAGAKIAYAGVPGEWVNLYAEAPTPELRDAALAFAKAYYSAWGKIEVAREANISIKGGEGKYTVKVDDGKVLEFKTEPVLGGDGKTAIVISNTKSLLNPTFMQARTLSGKYEEGSRSFTLKDSNSFFNDKLSSAGKL